jgi:DNA-directed RNA polymerase subunit RPC12/RpoP
MLNICFGIVLGSIFTLLGVLFYFAYGRMVEDRKKKDKLKEVSTCPYCGSEHLEWHENGNPYYCLGCGSSFNDDDLRFEEIRHELLSLLKGHTISKPLKCEIALEDDDAVGLSSLEMPMICAAYIDDEYSEIIFTMYGENRDINFDNISLKNAETILEEIKELKNN